MISIAEILNTNEFGNIIIGLISTNKNSSVAVHNFKKFIYTEPGASKVIVILNCYGWNNLWLSI